MSGLWCNRKQLKMGFCKHKKRELELNDAKKETGDLLQLPEMIFLVFFIFYFVA